MRKLKAIPAFKTEAEERELRMIPRLHRLEQGERANLKRSTTATSIRRPLGLWQQIKIAANRRDVPYQSLIKKWLAEKMG